MSRHAAALETDDRLLAAAGEVFAEVGYRGATLREICRRSHANIAAVNYHFRDKEHLYAAVLEQAVVEAGEGLARIAPDPADPPEEKLRHFIRQLLANMLGGERPVRFLRLMAHEAIEPTSAFDWVVEKAAAPLKEMLEEIVAEFFGPDAEPAQIHDCAASVMTQCAAYHHSEAFVKRLDHLDVHDPATIEHLADHIFRFSLGGIRTLARKA
jgi:TetR/AcrR family transcriptional regulator, regulator of cefoperazone and chloramphenicol sensitivity